MSLEEKRRDLLECLGAGCHPIRYKILSILDNACPFLERFPEFKGLYINEIAEKVGEDRRLIIFHLKAFEKLGMLQSNLAIIEEASTEAMGRLGRFFKLTEKGRIIFRGLWSLLRQIDFGVEKIEND